MLTRDVAGHGQALAMLVLEGGGDGVQPQEEKGLWAQKARDSVRPCQEQSGLQLPAASSLLPPLYGLTQTHALLPPTQPPCPPAPSPSCLQRPGLPCSRRNLKRRQVRAGAQVPGTEVNSLPEGREALPEKATSILTGSQGWHSCVPTHRHTDTQRHTHPPTCPLSTPPLPWAHRSPPVVSLPPCLTPSPAVGTQGSPTGLIPVQLITGHCKLCLNHLPSPFTSTMILHSLWGRCGCPGQGSRGPERRRDKCVWKDGCLIPGRISASYIPGDSVSL